MSSESSVDKSGLILSFLGLLVGAAWLGYYYWSHHHDQVAKNYSAGSVCDHQFAKDNIMIKSTATTTLAAKSGDVQEHNRALTDAAVEIQEGQIEEFNNMVAGLQAANAAVVSSGLKPLFCLSAQAEAPEFPLYNAYWKNTEVRVKQDAAVCRRDYPSDILVYLASAYSCGSAVNSHQ